MSGLLQCPACDVRHKTQRRLLSHIYRRHSELCFVPGDTWRAQYAALHTPDAYARTARGKRDLHKMVGGAVVTCFCGSDYLAAKIQLHWDEKGGVQAHWIAYRMGIDSLWKI